MGGVISTCSALLISGLKRDEALDEKTPYAVGVKNFYEGFEVFIRGHVDFLALNDISECVVDPNVDTEKNLSPTGSSFIHFPGNVYNGEWESFTQLSATSGSKPNLWPLPQHYLADMDVLCLYFQRAGTSIEELKKRISAAAPHVKPGDLCISTQSMTKGDCLNDVTTVGGLLVQSDVGISTVDIGDKKAPILSLRFSRTPEILAGEADQLYEKILTDAMAKWVKDRNDRDEGLPKIQVPASKSPEKVFSRLKRGDSGWHVASKQTEFFITLDLSKVKPKQEHSPHAGKFLLLLPGAVPDVDLYIAGGNNAEALWKTLKKYLKPDSKATAASAFLQRSDGEDGVGCGGILSSRGLDGKQQTRSGPHPCDGFYVPQALPPARSVVNSSSWLELAERRIELNVNTAAAEGKMERIDGLSMIATEINPALDMQGHGKKIQAGSESLEAEGETHLQYDTFSVIRQLNQPQPKHPVFAFGGTGQGAAWEISALSKDEDWCGGESTRKFGIQITPKWTTSQMTATGCHSVGVVELRYDVEGWGLLYNECGWGIVATGCTKEAVRDYLARVQPERRNKWVKDIFDWSDKFEKDKPEHVGKEIPTAEAIARAGMAAVLKVIPADKTFTSEPYLTMFVQQYWMSAMTVRKGPVLALTESMEYYPIVGEESCPAEALKQFNKPNVDLAQLEKVCKSFCLDKKKRNPEIKGFTVRFEDGKWDSVKKVWDSTTTKRTDNSKGCYCKSVVWSRAQSQRMVQGVKAGIVEYKKGVFSMELSDSWSCGEFASRFAVGFLTTKSEQPAAIRFVVVQPEREIGDPNSSDEEEGASSVSAQLDKFLTSGQGFDTTKKGPEPFPFNIQPDFARILDVSSEDAQVADFDLPKNIAVSTGMALFEEGGLGIPAKKLNGPDGEILLAWQLAR